MKIMNRLKICFLVTAMLFTACRIYEPYDEIYYHNIKGEGYVYYEDKPLPNADISVSNGFKSNGYATMDPINEYFTSDENGFFRVRFIRRTKHEDAIEYSICFSNDTLYYGNYDLLNFYNTITIYPKELRNAKENIKLGIITLKKNPY